MKITMSDHCQQFLLCGSVISLSFIQSFACIINYIGLSIFSFPKDCPDSKITIQFHGLPTENPNAHLTSFIEVYERSSTKE